MTPTRVRRPRAGLPEVAVICQCDNVTEKALERAWHAGCRDLQALARATRATTGCGGCAEDIRRLCGSSHAVSETALTEQEGAA